MPMILPPYKRPESDFEAFGLWVTLAGTILLGGAFLIMLIAALADLVMGLGWGFGWLSIAMFALGALFCCLIFCFAWISPRIQEDIKRRRR
jgi:hypothetical protein